MHKEDSFKDVLPMDENNLSQGLIGLQGVGNPVFFAGLQGSSFSGETTGMG